MKQFTYRQRPNNPDELLEMFAGSSMPTGRVFKKVVGNPDLSLKEVITLRDSLTHEYVRYVFSHIE